MKTKFSFLKKYEVSLVLFFFLFFGTFQMQAQSQPGAENEFLTPVKNYADALMKHGRDSYGDEKSPLFASVLNRKTMQIDPEIASVEISGVRERDRSVTGANMIHDISLFKILYEISQETGDKNYANEADKAINYFFNNCQSPATGLMCWGEHLFWNFLTDDCGYSPDYDFHEAKEWPFWDEVYQFAPDAAWQFALGEWEHQIHNKTTGDFSRHGRYSYNETFSGFDFPRYAGQMIERWADAYSRPENADRPRRNELLHYIEVVFNRMKENQQFSESGYLIAGRSPKGDHNSVVWLTNNLELARCLEEAASTMDPGLAKQMREFALQQDIDFLRAPHKLDSAGGGFAVTLHAKTGLPRTRSMNKPYSSTWSSGYGYGTHAGVANTIYGRYKNLKENHPDLAGRYKKLILLSGAKYLTSSPDTSLLLKPNEFADVIELMMNCYEINGEKHYLQRALYFAKFGMELFIKDGSPLPKATNRHNHYESITGGPSFMYQLLKLNEVLRNNSFLLIR